MNLINSIKSLDKSEIFFQELYESNYDSLMSICYRYAKNTEQAKAILKEGFVDIFSAVSCWDIDINADWMKMMMIDASVKYLKRNTQEYMIAGTVKAFNTYGIQEEEIIDDEIIPHLKAEYVINALQKLSPAYRLIVNMAFVDELSFGKIAEKLEIGENTAKMNYEKAMHALRKTIQQLSLNNA